MTDNRAPSEAEKKISKRCEVVFEWDYSTQPVTIKRQCGKPTAYFYPAAGCTNMALCEEHAQPHMKGAAAISLTKLEAPHAR